MHITFWLKYEQKICRRELSRAPVARQVQVKGGLPQHAQILEPRDLELLASALSLLFYLIPLLLPLRRGTEIAVRESV